MPKIIKNKTDKFDYDNRLDKDHTQLTIDKNNLKLWLDLKSTPEDRSNYSSEISSLSYEGSATSTLEKVNNLYYNAARFDNSENINALVTYSSGDNPISFTDGAGNDKPFSISLLFKRSSSDSDTLFENFFGKSDGTSTNVSYSGGYGILGGIPRVAFYLNTNASNYLRVYNSVTPINDDEWVHFVYTYDGSNSESGLNVYINGVNVTTTRQEIGTYSGMGHVGEKLYVGASTIGGNESDGQIAEFTIIDKELSSFEVKKLKDYLFEGISGVIGSGYINNPARVILKDRDNQLNTYPRIKQLNDVESSFALSSFNDNNAIVYGRRIKDDFNLERNVTNQYKRVVNSKKWVVGHPSTVVRKEDVARIQQFNQSEPAKGALVLDGPTRWLRTLKKVKNPTLNFTVLVGPYQFNNSSAINLYSSPKSNTLKVQVSGDGSTWEDIALEDRNIGNPYVNIHERGLDPTSPIFSNANRERLPLNELGRAKPQYTVKINSDQLYLPSDPSSSFYIRIIQETIAIQNRPSWAIYDIDIISREQTTIGQTGLQRSNSYALTSSFNTPNFLSSLEINNAASMAHLSDNLFSFSNNNPKISAFKDTKHIIDDGKEFYQYGVSPKSYPGFESPLSSKKIIEVDLSTQESIDLGRLLEDGGNAAQHAITGSGGLDSNLMTYWNKNLRRWEKIGWPLGVNDYGADTTANNIVNILSSSAIGFSSYGVMASGSASNSDPDPSANLLSNDLLASYNRPTDAFGFPFSARYHATGSQYILAKDLGINKPFLLEKAVLDFEMSAKINSDAGGIASAINLQNKYYAESAPSSNNIRHFTPTFFILNQKKSSYNNVKISVYTGSKESDIVEYIETLPKNIQLLSSSNDLTYVDDTRELITYGQHTFVYSGSHAPSSDYTPNISFTDFLESSIVRDGLSIYYGPNGLSIQASNYFFTGSFRTEFKCRNTAIISPFAPYYVVNRPGDQIGGSGNPYPSGYSRYANLRLGKQKTGRSFGKINAEGRALLNGQSSFTPSNIQQSIQYSDIPQSVGNSFFTNPVILAKDEGIDLDSPYLIKPEDKLIFGWQAPLHYRRISGDNDSSYMTIFGNSKLRLFGSEVKLGNEYHTGINQNLTTDNIHTVIGDDPVVDQFAVAPREELTGSIYDDMPYRVNSSEGIALIGKNLTVHETDPTIVDNGSTSGGNTSENIAFTKNALIPENRIGINVYSLVSLDSLPVSPLIKSYFSQVNGNFNLVDLERTFVDSRYRLSDNYYFSPAAPHVRPEYGSMQNIVADADGDDAAKLGGSPKYYYSGKHFGYFSDFMRQGLDGTFVDDPTTTLDNIFTESPIRIQFVKSEYNNTTVNREFSRIRPEEIDNTAEQVYQSSNLSLFATSSLPYKDDLVTRNRNYGEYEIVVS